MTTWLWGPNDIWVYALLTFIFADFFSGIMASYIAGQGYEWGKAIKGIVKKAMYLFPVVVATVADNVMEMGGVLRNAVLGLLIATEGISILDNCGRAGLPIVKPLVEFLERMRDKYSKAE